MPTIKLCVTLAVAGFLAQAPGAAAQTLAVFDLEADGIEVDQGLRERLGDFLGVKLSEAGHQVIGADRFREQAKGMRKCQNYACRIKLARWLGASRVLITKLLKFGQACQVTAELRDVDAEASNWAGAIETDCSDEALMHAIEKLNQKLVSERLGTNRRPEPGDGADAPEAVPPARLPAGSLSQADIRQYVKLHHKPLRACAELGRGQAKRRLRGVMWVAFTIDPDGQVSHSELMAKKFRRTPEAKCVAEVLAGMRFPAFSGKPIDSKLSLDLSR